MSLRTGAELITLSLLLNKLSGIYGLLALLTGFTLSPMQLSMYIYSVIALGTTAYLSSHIRRQSPFHSLALAWFYIIDSVVNASYTAAFAVTWFLVVSQHGRNAVAGPGNAGKTMGDAAGFTSPEYDVSHVDVVASPADGLGAGQDAVAMGVPSAPGGTANSGLGRAVLQPESITSIVVMSFLWAVRVYFVLVVMAFARSVLKQHVRSVYGMNSADSRKAPSSLPNPFDAATPEGQGWRARLGRIMVSIGRSYWLGVDSNEDESWALGVSGRFLRKDSTEMGGGGGGGGGGGVVERERRRRSGTDPPAPNPANLQVPTWQTGSAA